MGRTVASVLLTFLALAWGVVSLPLCFFYASSFWKDHLGRYGSFYGAVLAFGLCFLIARLLLRLADALIQPYTGPFDSRVYAAAPRESFFHDWMGYAQDIMRNRRSAFYARTRQWEKLAALEAEMAAARTTRQASPPQALRSLDAAAPPSLTSMADRLSPDEVRRGARRTRHDLEPARPNWRAVDEDEPLILR
jgi:hypothetical protein